MKYHYCIIHTIKLQDALDSNWSVPMCCIRLFGNQFNGFKNPKHGDPENVHVVCLLPTVIEPLKNKQ